MTNCTKEAQNDAVKPKNDAIDLISRKKALEVIDAILPVEPMKNEYTQGITCGAALAIEYVKQLPSAQTQWIPVTERLPSNNREVLISCGWGIDIGQYEKDGWRSEWFNHYDDDDVLAWMPLPDPYKGEDE